MSTGPKRGLTQAQNEADELRDLLGGTFARWQVAGSIRRGKPEVGDVEHVVIPRTGPVREDGSMFEVEKNLVLHRIDELVAAGRIQKAVYPDGKHRWGERLRGLVYKDFRHELFMADERNWGCILAIRTGPADFSREMVTNLHPRGYRQLDGYMRPAHSDDTIIEVPTEEEFFKLCGVPWLEPRARGVPSPTASTF